MGKLYYSLAGKFITQNLRSSELLLGVLWHFPTDVSSYHVGYIFRGKEFFVMWLIMQFFANELFSVKLRS